MNIKCDTLLSTSYKVHYRIFWRFYDILWALFPGLINILMKSDIIFLILSLNYRFMIANISLLFLMAIDASIKHYIDFRSF